MEEAAGRRGNGRGSWEKGEMVDAADIRREWKRQLRERGMVEAAGIRGEW